MNEVGSILRDPSRNEVLRERFLAVYIADPRSVRWYAKEIGVNPSVLHSLIKGEKREFRTSIVVKILNWLVKKERLSSAITTTTMS